MFGVIVADSFIRRKVFAVQFNFNGNRLGLIAFRESPISVRSMDAGIWNPRGQRFDIASAQFLFRDEADAGGAVYQPVAEVERRYHEVMVKMLGSKSLLAQLRKMFAYRLKSLFC